MPKPQRRQSDGVSSVLPPKKHSWWKGQGAIQKEPLLRFCAFFVAAREDAGVHFQWSLASIWACYLSLKVRNVQLM